MSYLDEITKYRLIIVEYFDFLRNKLDIFTEMAIEKIEKSDSAIPFQPFKTSHKKLRCCLNDIKIKNLKK